MKYDKVIYGTAKADNIDAFDISSSDTRVALYGLGGNDTLWAAAFIDGGAGDDTIHGAEDYSLDDGEIESIIYGGEGNDTIYDASSDSIIYGGNGNDTIFDWHGNDKVYAGAGDDYFSFDALHSSDGDKNEVFLGSGNDIGVMMLAKGDFQQNIDGGSGFDTLAFSSDYANDGSLAKVMDFRKLNAGSMTIDGSIVKDFERVILSDTRKTEIIYFGEYDDVFLGFGGNNRVYGFGGNDVLRAGAGGDAGSGGDRLFGGDGNDLIVAAGGGRVDFHRAYGEAGNDRIYANFDSMDYGSHSRLYGGSGKDGFISSIYGDKEESDYVMDFNPDEDWIGLYSGSYFRYDLAVTRPVTLEKTNIVDNEKELSFECVGMTGSGPYGIPVKVTYVKASGNLYIQDSRLEEPTLILNFKGTPDLLLKNFYYMTQQYGTWEKDLLHGDGKGNSLSGVGGDDTIYGAGGNDTIWGDGNEPWDPGGRPGKDALFGGKGDDAIYGGAGKDKITGGLGQDHLWGQAGSDTFIYSSLRDSTVDSGGRDLIYGFSRTQGDQIDLSAIDANSKVAGNQSFKFIGSAAYHGVAGEVRYATTGGDTHISGDINGDRVADFRVTLNQELKMIAADFIL